MLANVKARVGRNAPRWLVRGYRRAATAREFLRDYRDYAASTAWDRGSGRPDSRRDDIEAVFSRVTIAYHGLEKATTFPEPRMPYGKKKIDDITALLAVARASPTSAEAIVASRLEYHARSAIEAVRLFNAGGGISEEISPRASEWPRRLPVSFLREFAETRHSVRNFDASRRVDRADIEEFVGLASTTPSVCNRRSYRAHFFDDPEMIARLLALQNGNRGFGHVVPGLFVITERRSAFVGAGERNQRWIDGGLFAMSLVWFAHGLGLSTCFLNWSQPNSASDKLRRCSGIDNSEDIIVLIAIGYGAKDHRAARSPRRAIDDTLVVHEEWHT